MTKARVMDLIQYDHKDAFSRFGEVVPDFDLWDVASIGREWHLQWIEGRANELGIELVPSRTRNGASAGRKSSSRWH